ncbi:hypothetical protein JP0129_07620 [Helicobacter pylori]|nr:hypothetical protein JP0104_06510 [Helicobacter pylori]GHS53908.1 hypothetical protein JP0129_07620 [Helicobacter pylori]
MAKNPLYRKLTPSLEASQLANPYTNTDNLNTFYIFKNYFSATLSCKIYPNYKKYYYEYVISK